MISLLIIYYNYKYNFKTPIMKVRYFYAFWLGYVYVSVFIMVMNKFHAEMLQIEWRQFSYSWRGTLIV